MVNVNTQVSSSMELPFGEYTLLFLLTYVCGYSNRKSSVASVRFFFILRWFVQQPFQSSAGSRQSSGWKYPRHMCLAFSHGCNPGGVSEIWRLLKRPWELGLMVMMVQRAWDVRAVKVL